MCAVLLCICQSGCNRDNSKSHELSGEHEESQRREPIRSDADSLDAQLETIRNLIYVGDYSLARKEIKQLAREDLKEEFTVQLHQAIEKRIISELRLGPEKVMQDIINGNFDCEIFWLEVAMRGYLAKNPKNAYKWYSLRKSECSPGQLERLALALARYETSRGEFEQAAKHQKLILDPELNKVVGGEIGRAIELMIRKRVRRAGESVLNQIVDGSMKVEIFWLEVAVNELIAMDEKRAQVWYHETWGKMTAAQKERVALAYGRDALKKGDVKRAQLWLKEMTAEKLIKVFAAEIQVLSGGK